MADAHAVPARPSLARPSMFAAVWWLCVLGGWAVFGFGLARLSGEALAAMGAPLVMMAALVVVGELRPVVTSWTGSIPVPFSTAFVFATLYLWGLAPAAALMAVGVLTSEIAQRKQPWKVLFNVGQYTLSVAAAWLVMVAVGVRPTPLAPGAALDGGDLWWLVLTWVAYHLVNLALVAGLAESDGQTFVESFTEEFWFYTFSTMSVLALSPLIAIVADESGASWVLLPLLVLPLVAVYATARMSRDREHASLHDALTGLPNRRLLARRTAQALEDAGRVGGTVALCLLDLDRFKEVNDTLGHPAGDHLLRQVADRLRAVLRPSDTVARLGGDEFALLLPGVGGERGATEVAQRIQAALADPVHLHGVLLDVAASIGVALEGDVPPGPVDRDAEFESLLRRADVAMYVAKGTRSRIAVYDPDRDPHSPHRLGAAGALRRALDDGLLDVHFQPKVSLHDSQVIGMEALARWTHPDLGPMPPEEFVSLAERTGLIHQLTAYVLDRSLAQSARWRRDGMPVPVAVNVSVRDLQDGDAVAAVAAGLARYGLPPDAVVLEITESVVVRDATRVVSVLQQLRDAGVQSSLDDFGTGYSTLTLLQQLPVSELKIDRSFVAALGTGGSVGLVRAVVGLGHALGLRVVAEGVETPSLLRQLRDLGCDAAQGWVHAPALPAADATEWLRQHGAGRPDLRLVGDAEPGTA